MPFLVPPKWLKRGVLAYFYVIFPLARALFFKCVSPQENSIEFFQLNEGSILCIKRHKKKTSRSFLENFPHDNTLYCRNGTRSEEEEGNNPHLDWDWVSCWKFVLGREWGGVKKFNKLKAVFHSIENRFLQNLVILANRLDPLPWLPPSLSQSVHYRLRSIKRGQTLSLILSKNLTFTF